MKKRVVFAQAVAGRFLDRIYKIDRIKKESRTSKKENDLWCAKQSAMQLVK